MACTASRDRINKRLAEAVVPTCPVLPPCWQRVCPPKKSNENQAVKIECDVIGVCERETFQCDDGRLICLTILQKQTSLPTTIKRKEVFLMFPCSSSCLSNMAGWMELLGYTSRQFLVVWSCCCWGRRWGGHVTQQRPASLLRLSAPRSRRFWRTYVQKREREREKESNTT